MTAHIALVRGINVGGHAKLRPREVASTLGGKV